MDSNDLIYWTFAISALLAVVAALVATRVRGEWLPELLPAHVAGAALLALFGWEVLIYLPGTVRAYLTTVAGIVNPPGVADQQAFMAASAAFAAATMFAVIGILRRRPWAIVLGIGLGAARAAMSLAAVASFLSFAESFMPDQFALMVGEQIARTTVPALAAVGLLLWPLLRRSPTEAPPQSVDWSAEPSPEAGR